MGSIHLGVRCFTHATSTPDGSPGQAPMQPPSPSQVPPGRSSDLAQPRVTWSSLWFATLRVVSFRNKHTGSKSGSHATCPYIQSWHSWTYLVTSLESVDPAKALGTRGIDMPFQVTIQCSCLSHTLRKATLVTWRLESISICLDIDNTV